MRKLALIGLLFCLGLTACASDPEGEPAPEAEQTAEAVAPTDATSATEAGGTEAPVSLSGELSNHGIGQLEGGNLEMEADDFYFEPTFVGADAGASTVVVIHNEGDVPHTFTIDEMGIDETIEPGQEVEVDVTLPDQLPVRFYCRFHQAQGMQGAFFAG